MKETERDKFDDLFRANLQDFEVASMPEDWDLIARRLPAAKSVPFKTIWRYIAAAVVSILIATGAVTLFYDTQEAIPVAHTAIEHIKPNEQTIVSEVQEVTPSVVVSEQLLSDRISEKSVLRKRVSVVSVHKEHTLIAEVDKSVMQDAIDLPIEEILEVNTPVTGSEEPEKQTLYSSNNRSVTVASAEMTDQPKSKKNRKWGFGMGAGSLGAGTGSSIGNFVTPSAYSTDNRLLMMNSVAAYNQPPKTDIDHRTPVSFGLAVSKRLNDRFALQSGLTYTFLASELKTNGIYHNEAKRKLHYLGIPVSLVYNIAEWNSFLFYASAGVMGEINVAGKVNTRLFSKNKEITNTSEKVRMKELLWSTNARVGVSYPIIRFVSAFAEAGVTYYFDNGSDMETIRSEKPFNASFQVGFRLGF